MCLKKITSTGDVYNNQINENTSLYQFIKELAELRLELETRREDSLINQATAMQTAFSFTSAAILMAVPIFIPNYSH